MTTASSVEQYYRTFSIKENTPNSLPNQIVFKRILVHGYRRITFLRDWPASQILDHRIALIIEDIVL